MDNYQIKTSKKLFYFIDIIIFIKIILEENLIINI